MQVRIASLDFKFGFQRGLLLPLSIHSAFLTQHTCGLPNPAERMPSGCLWLSLTMFSYWIWFSRTSGLSSIYISSASWHRMHLALSSMTHGSIFLHSPGICSGGYAIVLYYSHSFA
ncbi:hypothetical protein L208DRAFT_329021 [Tricholoma matsutake]|nr:hypothetical protein L208DRAFT_329021 [Tricholoma matsutake 945]